MSDATRDNKIFSLAQKLKCEAILELYNGSDKGLNDKTGHIFAQLALLINLKAGN